MEPGDVIDLDITDVAHGGVFVGRHLPVGSETGRVVFVPDAIPGERIRLRLTDLGRAAFWRGEALEVLDASPHRRRHVWPAADIDVPPEHRPGGADFGHIDPEHQRQLKLHVLQDALHRIGGLQVPATIAPAPPVLDERGDIVDQEHPDGTRWRTRVSLHVDTEGRVGPFAARSHRVIPVDDLPLATAGIERAAQNLTGAKAGRIDLVQPADGRVRIIARPHERRPPHRRGHAGAWHPSPRQAANPAREVVTERAGGRDFAVDAGGFWQVHRLAAPTLWHLVTAKLESRVDPEASHLDLYGGVGLFAAALAQAAGTTTTITSVESDARATAHARRNLAELTGARAETGRVDQWLQRLRSEASARQRRQLSRGVVVLDPPRSGAGRQVVDSIVDLGPETVVYVACDPVALARDLRFFHDAGYETPQVDAVDLFPHSHHLESVAVLTRPTGNSLSP